MASSPGSGRPDDQVTVSVPQWAVSGWSDAGRVAGTTFLVFLAAGFLLLVATAVIVLIRFGGQGLDLDSLLGSVLTLPLAYLGALTGSPVLLTGLAVLVYALRKATEGGVGVRGDELTRESAIALALKIALVFVGILLVLAVLVDVLDLVPSLRVGGALGLVQTTQIDYVRIVFLTGPVVAFFAFWAIARAENTSVLGLLGVQGRLPGVLTTSWTGAKRTLSIALVGLVVLFAVGSLLEVLGNDYGDFSALANALLTIILLVVVFVAVDIAVLFFVSAMSFLQFQSIGSGSVWEWVGVVLVAVAFFLGGRAAAERASPKTVAEAVMASSLVGVLLAGLGALVAINYEGLANLEDFGVPAILLPIAWTIPALVGAWFYANEKRLPSGVTVAVVGEGSPGVGGGVGAGSASVAVAADGDAQLDDSQDDSTDVVLPLGVEPGTEKVEETTADATADSTPEAADSVPPETKTDPGSTSTFCTSCGSENPSSNSFCSSCGNELPKGG